MGFFDKLFGKEEEKKEENFASDMTLRDLKNGAILDYDGKSWKVIDHYQYNWGNNFDTNEFALDSGDDKVFLHIEDDSGLKCMVSRETKIKLVDANLKDAIIKTGTPLANITFEGTSYKLENEFESARFRKFGASGWSEFSGWEYYDETDKYCISINRYDKMEFEAYYGEVVAEYHFTNILPSK